MPAPKPRIGLMLFGIYLVVYGGFVLLNAFAPDVMRMKPLLGINLAILYGFSLILLAFGLAVIYGFLSRNQLPSTPSASVEKERGR